MLGYLCNAEHLWQLLFYVSWYNIINWYFCFCSCYIKCILWCDQDSSELPVNWGCVFLFFFFFVSFPPWHGEGKCGEQLGSPETSSEVLGVCCLWVFWFRPKSVGTLTLYPYPRGEKKHTPEIINQSMNSAESRSPWSTLNPTSIDMGSRQGDRSIRTHQTTDTCFRNDTKICF